MEKILGNFIHQPNRDFPLDAETLDYLQNLTSISAIVGNIAGDKVILCGCESTDDGVRRNPGWVFVKTKLFPNGEILYWEGGSTTSGMYLKQERVGVTVNNVEYGEAYTKRSLMPGIGDEWFGWDTFTELRTISELIKENKSLQEKLDVVQTTPIGAVILWAGGNPPDGYVLCDGRELSTASYPELYEVIGSAYNSAVSSNGINYSTTVGNFRVPDLRGRFVVGQHDSDNDYKTKGSGGGDKKVVLTENQLPGHSHNLKDYYFAEDGSSASGCNFDRMNVNKKIGSGKHDFNNTVLIYVEHDTKETGKGESHENRPPYYVLAYIMRAK
ncbi:MAG: phage tail protein [Paramuribaculum sp.]|nr:phage tail protein [Paramuribaculum sp.]